MMKTTKFQVFLNKVATKVKNFIKWWRYINRPVDRVIRIPMRKYTEESLLKIQEQVASISDECEECLERNERLGIDSDCPCDEELDVSPEMVMVIEEIPVDMIQRRFVGPSGYVHLKLSDGDTIVAYMSYQDFMKKYDRHRKVLYS